MLFQLGLLLFAIAAGFAASGIIACLYRMVATKPSGRTAKAVHFAVMIFAGPNVLIGNAARSLKARDCSKMAFWFAAVIAGYWSLMLGLLVIQIGMKL